MIAGLGSVLQTIHEQALSTSIRESTWTYPLIESVHVITIAMFVGFAVLLDMRLMGILLTDMPVSRVSSALLPRTRWAFIVMFLSGVVLFYAKPTETAANPFFQIKLVFIAIAALNIYYFHRIASADIAVWDTGAAPPRGVKISGLVSIVCWVSVVACGRLIAYNWFK
jgi:hypothetical protein